MEMLGKWVQNNSGGVVVRGTSEMTRILSLGGSLLRFVGSFGGKLVRII